jgi:hypothetical protein
LYFVAILLISSLKMVFVGQMIFSTGELFGGSF